MGVVEAPSGIHAEKTSPMLGVSPGKIDGITPADNSKNIRPHIEIANAQKEGPR